MSVYRTIGPTLVYIGLVSSMFASNEAKIVPNKYRKMENFRVV